MTPKNDPLETQTQHSRTFKHLVSLSSFRQTSTWASCIMKSRDLWTAVPHLKSWCRNWTGYRALPSSCQPNSGDNDAPSQGVFSQRLLSPSICSCYQSHTPRCGHPVLEAFSSCSGLCVSLHKLPNDSHSLTFKFNSPTSRSSPAPLRRISTLLTSH